MVTDECGASGEQPSDLRQSDAQGVWRPVDGQDEGVLVGVVLDDVVIHVHQDPEDDQTHKQKRARVHFIQFGSFSGKISSEQKLSWASR